MSVTTPRVLVFGAHPDDAEFHVGGLLSLYRELGFTVKIISVTNGAAGHFEIAGDELARRRCAEAQAAAGLIGSVFEAWDYPDGQLEPSLDIRTRVIREIRTFKPDLVLTHRPYDYHPDHRAVAQLVQDASYMVTVPPIVPDTPILRHDPVVAYMPDLFTRPNSLRADVIIDVTEKMDQIVRLLACHVSQVFEWMPFNEGFLDQVPVDKTERLSWLRSWVEALKQPFTERYQAPILEAYGCEEGEGPMFVEVLEISEYASPLDQGRQQRLFPFVPLSR